VIEHSVEMSGYARRLRDDSRPAAAGTERQRPRVLFIGLFPPPVNGQRIVTQHMLERLDAIAAVTRYNIDRFHQFGVLSKLLSAIAACGALIAARLRGCSTLYLAPHSGAGLIYSCLIALAGRCAGYRLTVHYHSYRNMARYNSLMAAFLAICGPRALHIVLAPPMARDLRRFYRSARHVTVLSNTTFVQPEKVRRAFGSRRLRLGHLSNLSREKGIGIVLECMRELRARDVDVELWLAGPTEDSETSQLVSAAQAAFGERVRYLGRLDAIDVHRFYSDIDVFLFPTSYEHEAEPLVVVDAISVGVPVIATDRGCIAYLLGVTGGCVLNSTEFVPQCVEQIARWAREPDQLARVSERAQAGFAELHAQSRLQLSQVLAAIVHPPVEHARRRAAKWQASSPSRHSP
jgi:glycosyltransferase involved in cell wall biosynthesis